MFLAVFLLSLAVFGSRKPDLKSEACQTGLYSWNDTFTDNFGFKHSDGGALVLSCDELMQFGLRADFYASSQVNADWTVED